MDDSAVRGGWLIPDYSVTHVWVRSAQVKGQVRGEFRLRLHCPDLVIKSTKIGLITPITGRHKEHQNWSDYSYYWSDVSPKELNKTLRMVSLISVALMILTLVLPPPPYIYMSEVGSGQRSGQRCAQATFILSRSGHENTKIGLTTPVTGHCVT